jgi:hypothetical protein
MSVSFLFPPGDEAEYVLDARDQERFKVRPAPAQAKTKRDTKAIGDRSELEVAVVLARRGYTVSKPIGDSFRYDLIIDDGANLYRVQVKTGRLRHGSIQVHCYSVHAQRAGGITCRSYRGEIDFLGVFCPQTGGVYLIPESEMVDSTMHLRVDPTVNRQDRHIRWASRFRLDG